MLGLLLTDEYCHHLSASGCGILPPKGSEKILVLEILEILQSNILPGIM
jgi:hypothetical protein